MDSAMEEKNKNESPEEQKKNDRNPKENIPLWLQGLEEPEPEDTALGDSDNESVEDWIKETESASINSAEIEVSKQEADEILEDTEEVPIVSGLASDSEEPLPDWLGELSAVDATSPEIEDSPEIIPTPSEHEIIKDIDSLVEEEAPGEGFPKALDEPLEAMPSEEDFLEISEINLENIPEPELEDSDEFVPEDEALPDWLHEMISEKSEMENAPESSDEVLGDIQDEPTEPVDIAQEANTEEKEEVDMSAAEVKETAETATPELEEGLDEEEFTEDTSPVTASVSKAKQTEESIEEPSMEENQEKPSPITSPVDNIEKDTTPPTAKEQEESEEKEPALISSTEEEMPPESSLPIQETTQPVAVPKSLRFAKYFLDQGDVGRALEIINTHIEQSTYLNEIKTWLVETVDDRTQHNSEVWESLGDIAVHEGNHQDALTAYTKAIKTLLSKKEVDEAG
jgi:hypothetical protein